MKDTRKIIISLMLATCMTTGLSGCGLFGASSDESPAAGLSAEDITGTDNTATADPEDNTAGTDNTTGTETGAGTETTTDAANAETKALSGLYKDFIDSKISATATYEGEEREVWFKDLPQDPNEWDSYKISDEEVDLDNDGENELILSGPYGGMYLDARDGKMFVLAEGEGTAGELGHVEYDGKMYITHQDTSHGGRQVYLFDCYNGKGEVTDSFTLSAEYWNEDYDYYNTDSDFTFRDKKITMEEYEKLMKEIFDRPTKIEIGKIWADAEFSVDDNGAIIKNDGSDTFYDAMDQFYGEYEYKQSEDGKDGTLAIIQELDGSRQYSLYDLSADGYRFSCLSDNVEYIKGNRLYMKASAPDDDILKNYIITNGNGHRLVFETDENYENPVYLYTAWDKY